MPKINQNNPMYFVKNFNTELTPEEEVEFAKWMDLRSKQVGRDAYMDLQDYDMRGAWKEISKGDMSEDDRGHLGDRYKKPNHPTFSNESIYNGTKNEAGGVWQGGKWGDNSFSPEKGQWSIRNKDSQKFLQNYFQRIEPGYKVVMPK